MATRPIFSMKRKYKLSEYTLLSADYVFIAISDRDRYFDENPNKLQQFDDDDKLCINIRWDLILEPKSILQCRCDGEWITIWENGNAKKGYEYSNKGNMMNLNRV